MSAHGQGRTAAAAPETWPLVDPLDSGIRPAGRPDECFYCQKRVGIAHARDCVIVTKRVEMRVTATLPTGETFIACWQFDEPHDLTAHMSEFLKNESSWCAGNFVDELDGPDVRWITGATTPAERLTALHDAGDCLCGVLRFEFVRVVDGSPRRKTR